MMPTNKEYSEAYIQEKFAAAQRAGKAFVKNLSLIDLVGKIVRIEFDDGVYDVSAKVVEIEEIEMPSS